MLFCQSAAAAESFGRSDQSFSVMKACEVLMIVSYWAVEMERGGYRSGQRAAWRGAGRMGNHR
jgi:hypothetical protein